MQYQNNRLPALSRIFITKHVRLYVNVVNIMVIIHAGGAEVYQETGETGIFYKARPGRLALYILSVPVEGKGFKKDR